ncbi:thioesterase II family protein [Paractinoplanes brasiliensis]|uniref:Surfactin synthase thioesterase subunit n=1 Tax=Paractinoplanes brasiliensis TaxID=52695 RepID=A0A4R6JCW5_9ACTN|nr:alpha/beta fold hydrolase [Actinoplanes brasiliensis]TDO33197.1 surfactin synthase thioesterase subunit [Actinoplanes brasiliensis]GID33226.1 thioesterase [Actinoplanes brasiliensis]
MTNDTAQDLWVRRYHPGAAARPQLVCLPHAGGSASFYFPLSRALAADVEVLTIQYPGRQERRSEPCITQLPVLAERIYQVLRPLAAERPLAFFGHSMGATLAFEVARKLETVDGVVAPWLFASGRRAPSRHRDERVYQQDDKGMLAELRRLNGTENNVLDDDEMVALIMPAIRGDYTAAETYRYQPGPPLSCPVTAFVGDADPKVTLDEARAWQEHTTGAFDMHTYPGGHFYLTRHQAAVLKVMAAKLATAKV